MNVEHTLAKTSELPTEKKTVPLRIREGLMIKAPYKTWDIKRVIISAPVPGTSKNGAASFFTCKIEYDYILSDGTTKKAPFQIEFPNEPGKRAISPWGITEVLEFIEKAKLEELKKDPNFKQKGTGRHSITCALEPRLETTSAILIIMQQLYAKCVEFMFKNGKKGSGILGDVTYPIPEGVLGPENTADHLKYPVIYSTTEGRNHSGGIIKVVDLKGTVKFPMAVKLGGRYGVEIVDKDAKPMIDEIEGQGFEHVPLMIIETLYIGAKCKIRTKMDSTVVTEILPPRTMQQESTLAYLKANPEAATKSMIDEVGDVFGQGEFGDEKLQGTGGDDNSIENSQDELPDPIPTPPSNPISPAKPTTRAAAQSSVRPNGSPKAYARNQPVQPR